MTGDLKAPSKHAQIPFPYRVSFFANFFFFVRLFSIFHGFRQITIMIWLHIRRIRQIFSENWRNRGVERSPDGLQRRPEGKFGESERSLAPIWAFLKREDGFGASLSPKELSTAWSLGPFSFNLISDPKSEGVNIDSSNRHSSPENFKPY